MNIFLIDFRIRFTVIYSYPDGDNNDKWTHLSLYICIKQGEFDIICIGPSRTIWNGNWWIKKLACIMSAEFWNTIIVQRKILGKSQAVKEILDMVIMILWSSLNCYRFLPCAEGTKFGSRPYHKSNLKCPDVIFEMSFTMIFWCTCPCKF